MASTHVKPLYNPYDPWANIELPGSKSLLWSTHYVGPVRDQNQVLPFHHLLPNEKLQALRYGKRHHIRNIVRSVWRFNFKAAKYVHQHDAKAINSVTPDAVAIQQKRIANVGLSHALILGTDIPLQTALCVDPTHQESNQLTQVVKMLTDKDTNAKHTREALALLDTLTDSSPTYSPMIPCLFYNGMFNAILLLFQCLLNV